MSGDRLVSEVTSAQGGRAKHPTSWQVAPLARLAYKSMAVLRARTRRCCSSWSLALLASLVEPTGRPGGLRGLFPLSLPSGKLAAGGAVDAPEAFLTFCTCQLNRARLTSLLNLAVRPAMHAVIGVLARRGRGAGRSLINDPDLPPSSPRPAPHLPPRA